MVSRNLNEYLQIDLLSLHAITSIKTQGRFGKGQGQEFTEAYVVEFWRPSFGNKWKRWKNTQGKEVSGKSIWFRCWRLGVTSCLKRFEFRFENKFKRDLDDAEELKVVFVYFWMFWLFEMRDFRRKDLWRLKRFVKIWEPTFKSNTKQTMNQIKTAGTLTET
jgi:hypothetical protein